MIFGWKSGREHGHGGPHIPVRFDPEFMQTLRTVDYSDYRLRVVQTVELSDEEAAMPLDDLAKKYPFHQIRRRVFGT